MNSHESAQMSFLDHLEILRWHLIRSGIAILLFSVLAFIFKEISSKQNIILIFLRKE